MYLLQVFLVMWVEKSDDVLKHWYLGSVLEITALKEKNYLFLYNTHCKKLHLFYIEILIITIFYFMFLTIILDNVVAIYKCSRLYSF